ncbi:MAG: hypothetical protein MdMp014T_1953 [Treponematales bacterium]
MAGTHLTVSGSGSLDASGGLYAAGIGGWYPTENCGVIVITNGEVRATGGLYGSGIGGGRDAAG